MESLKALFQEVRKRPWVFGIIIVAILLLGSFG